MPAPVILALDTATPHLTLALCWTPAGQPAGQPDQTLEISREVGRAHAELLPGAVAELFAQAGLPMWASQIVIGTGPGSYTGVRVGASYALGLGRVWGAPVVGVSTLEGLVRGDGPQAVSQDARKGNIYSAIYQATGGVVTQVLEPVAKRDATEFEALAGTLPHWKDTAPSGLALLRAGLAHGRRDWELAYL